ncbi:speckle-type POZ protein B-like [Parasteatoda tepidariorum]|uniref:speckle-type POZ protein B-like n=1 Tax=Parasteatoda tepidariorum TaxID=114398 RepID=UPI001C7213A9|nr:speckle-type POZ protein B-like [Parasteatoda tepidariorum]
MYDPSMFSDFVFKVGDQSFPAHKIILSAHSPVFKNMMTHEFEESKTNSVTITDATPEIFDLFLRYLYSGEIEVKCWDSLKALYYLSDKYDIGILKTKCAETAISILSVDSACDILKAAYTYSDSHIITTAKQFAVQHLKEIVLREDWKELVTTHPLIGYEVTLYFVSK